MPHAIEGGAEAVPVSIGWHDPTPARDLLINLCDELPGCAGDFARIAELVSSDEDSRKRSRTRFAAYRDAGHDIETHKL